MRQVCLGAILGVLVGTITGLVLGSGGGDYVRYDCPEVREMLNRLRP